MRVKIESPWIDFAFATSWFLRNKENFEKLYGKKLRIIKTTKSQFRKVVIFVCEVIDGESSR